MLRTGKQESNLYLRLPPSLKIGMPGGTRTHNLQLRKLTLYPIELQAHIAGEKLRWTSRKLDSPCPFVAPHARGEDGYPLAYGGTV